MTSREHLRQIGHNIRVVREQRAITQECLAEMADLHYKTVQYVEGGRFSLGVVSFVRIVQALRVSADRLLVGIPPLDQKRVAAILKAKARKRRPRKRSKP